MVEGSDGTYSFSLWSSGSNFHDDLDFSGSLDSSLLPPTEFTTELLADTPLSEAEADAPRLFVGIDRGHGHGDGSPLGDIFIGGAGDDTYVVDSTNAIIDETAPGSGGIDTVLSSIDYTAPAGIENVELTGTAPTNATGNGADNVLTGNSGDNALSGGSCGEGQGHCCNAGKKCRNERQTISRVPPAAFSTAGYQVYHGASFTDKYDL